MIPAEAVEAVTKAERKKAHGILRASLIAELWPQMNCSYFELADWAQEYVDMVVAQNRTTK